MLWAGFVIVGVLFGPVTPAEARKAAAEVFRDPAIQRHWSDERTPEPERDPGPSTGGPRRRPPPAAPPIERDDDSSRRRDSSPAPEALLWILLGLGLAVAAFQLVRAWRGPAAKDARAPGAPALLATGGAGGVAAPPPDAAAVLAEEGRFAEAVHTLLLVALAAVGRRAYHDASLTSREVAAAAGLAVDASAALAALVRAVEVSRFGGRALDGADYDAARAHLDRVRAALAGPAA